MRKLQRNSAASRWGDLSPSERSAEMKRLRAKTKRKPKAGKVKFYRKLGYPLFTVADGWGIVHGNKHASERKTFMQNENNQTILHWERQ